MRKFCQLVVAAIASFLLLTAASQAAQPGMRCVQNQLNTLGFDAGTADGLIGGKTRAAAEAYRVWMATTNDGWVQPPLNKSNGQLWCENVGKDHPKVAKFQTESPSTTLIIQFRGNVRSGTQIYVKTERANTPECPRPCIITKDKRLTINPDTNGVASISLTLSPDATRACVHMAGIARISSAVLFMNSGRKQESPKGADLNADGSGGCSYWLSDAKKAATWILELE